MEKLGLENLGERIRDIADELNEICMICKLQHVADKLYDACYNIKKGVDIFGDRLKWNWHLNFERDRSNLKVEMLLDETGQFVETLAERLSEILDSLEEQEEANS